MEKDTLTMQNEILNITKYISSYQQQIKHVLEENLFSDGINLILLIPMSCFCLFPIGSYTSCMHSGIQPWFFPQAPNPFHFDSLLTEVSVAPQKVFCQEAPNYNNYYMQVD